MALVQREQLPDGCSFQANVGGTGTFTFGAARPSFMQPSQAVALGLLVDGQFVSYVATDKIGNATQREWGRGVFHSGSNAVERTQVLGTVDVGGFAGVGSPLNFVSPPFVSLTGLSVNFGRFGYCDQNTIQQNFYVTILTGTIVAGAGGVAGTYSNVPLTGGHGGGNANIVVASGGVTQVRPIQTTISGYQVGDVLSAAPANIGGTTGFSFTVTAIGSDANGNGTQAAPWATPQQAWNWLALNADLFGDNQGSQWGGNLLNVAHDNGVYKGDGVDIWFADPSFAGGGVQFSGNGGDRTAVAYAAAPTIYGFHLGALFFQYIDMSLGGGGGGPANHSACTVDFSNCDFNKIVTLPGGSPAVTTVGGHYTLKAGGDVHIHVQDTGFFGWYASTLSVPSPVNFSTGFLFCASMNMVDYFTPTIDNPGNITGPRFAVFNNSYVNALGWNRDSAPGSTFGSVGPLGCFIDFNDFPVMGGTVSMTYAQLPPANKSGGTTYLITDGPTSPSFWALASGGGSTVVKVTSDGTNWRIG